MSAGIRQSHGWVVGASTAVRERARTKVSVKVSWTETADASTPGSNATGRCGRGGVPGRWLANAVPPAREADGRICRCPGRRHRRGQVDRADVHVATATSHFVLANMAAVGTVTHLAAGSFAGGTGLHRSIALSVGVVGGAQVGAWLSQRTRSVVIQRLLAVALAGLAVRLLFTVL